MSETSERSVASDGSAAGDPRKCPASAAQVSLVPAEMYHALVVAHEEVARLRLTDAEGDAIEAAANAYQRRFDDGVGLLNDGPSECGKIAATLRGLLERLGAANSGDNRRSVGGEHAGSAARDRRSNHE